MTENDTDHANARLVSFLGVGDYQPTTYAFQGRLCDRGVTCEILSLDMDQSDRGRDLTAEDLEAAGARLVRVRASMTD